MDSQAGGCELGPRPIDLHLAALERLGVEIREDHGYLDCRCPGGMHGAVVPLPFPSVGATENIMIAASLAQGETLIQNAAREPEIADLAAFLNGCGAKIRVDAQGDIIVEGVSRLHGCEHAVIPDRIAAATYLCAAAITGGEVELSGVCPAHLSAVLPCFEEMGCQVIAYNDRVRLCGRKYGRLRPLHVVRTMPYPGFPTDAQSPLMAVASVADGSSVFIENIFESRFKHVPELCRMGADIKVEGRVAVIHGIPALHSASVYCTDLRGGAALCVAALAAQGETALYATQHIDRGYESLEKNLSGLGADIERVPAIAVPD